MKLEEIYFLGHQLKGTSFSTYREPSGSGYYNYSNQFVESGIDIYKETVDGEDRRYLKINAESSVEGFESETHEIVFELDIEYQIKFRIDSISDFGLKDIKENDWFFLNFLASSSREIIESILSHSAMRSIPIPNQRNKMDDFEEESD